jgi:hypothetical protein
LRKPDLIEQPESRMSDAEPTSPGDRVLSRYDVIMREHVAPALRELGFTGTRRKFTMRQDGACGVVAWQKDSRFYWYGQVRFTANMDWWCGSGRIGELIPAYTPDTWWTVTADEPAAPVVRSVVTTIRCFALPAVLAGLEDPAQQPNDPAMHEPWARREPDGGGQNPMPGSSSRPARSTTRGSPASPAMSPAIGSRPLILR